MAVNQPPITSNDEVDRFNKELTDELNRIAEMAGDIEKSFDGMGRVVIGGSTFGYDERYLSTRYGTNSAGADFTDDYTTISGLTVWQGFRNSAAATESVNPADYSWVELNVVAGWKPSYRIIGGRDIDWDYSTVVPTGFTLDNVAGVIDLDNFSSGATGPAGESSRIDVAYATDIMGTNGVYPTGTRSAGDYTEAVIDSTHDYRGENITYYTQAEPAPLY